MSRPITKRNYYDAPKRFWSASRCKTFLDCPARAVAEISGGYERPDTTALLVGSYVDAAMAGKAEFVRWVQDHPQIFKKNGELKAEYSAADVMIDRMREDKVFRSFLVGQRQKIMVGEIGGLPFKCKMDFYRKGRWIVDLKTTRDFNPVYLPEQGRVSFADAYHYPLQMAIYQELVRQNTGETLPCYLAVVTKEIPPDLAVIEIPQEVMDAELEVLKAKLPIWDAMRLGVIEPERCGHCAYCRQSHKITGPVRLDEFGGGIIA